jgi:SAM-dependent methyltransferase
VFNAAADFYDDGALTFWGEVARNTIDRIGVRSDERVLDVCCGSGSSALLAAERGARVTGIDVAENLLALARAKAKQRGLRNVEFIHADMAAIELPPASFDAVVIVFGIFFVPDMERQLSDLWQFVAPGGRIAVTSWGERCLEPGQSAIFDAMNQFRPDLVPDDPPWVRIKSQDAIRRLFADACLPEPDIETEPLITPLADPDGVWKTALGSGFRGAIDELSDLDREQMRDDLRSREIGELVSDIHYAVAAKPFE